MTVEVEITMLDKTKKHEKVDVKTIDEAHQLMHKKYKGNYSTTVIM